MLGASIIMLHTMLVCFCFVNPCIGLILRYLYTTCVMAWKYIVTDRVQLISTVTNRGMLRFMHFKGVVSSQLPIRFFKRLIKATDRKVFLILDNLRVQHSKRVNNWVAALNDDIELFYLPSYSTERNPDEYFNGNLKRTVHGQMPSRSEAEMRRKTTSRLLSTQKRPKHVRRYFENEFIQYAA